MSHFRLALSLAGLILLGSQAFPIASADAPAPPGPIGEQSDADADATGLLTISGTVLSPDGDPAAGATVEAISRPEGRPIASRTDDRGRFRLRGIFGNVVNLHASSSDGTHQEIVTVPAAAARTAFATPIELRLSPAIAHEVVVVTSNGEAVAGAHVVASGNGFRIRGLTGEDGTAGLRLPAGEPLGGVVAWHPESGVNGLRDLEEHPLPDETRISLLPPGPHRVLVLDPEGEPVEGLELEVNARTEHSGWIVTDQIEEARVRTDAEGEAIVPWMPQENLRYVDLNILTQDWKIDRVDLERLAEGITTVHARRKVAVEGRLVMPEGVGARGLLVTGFGFGPGDRGDNPAARVRDDGRFTLHIPSDHAYVLGVADVEWASDHWSGLILGKETWEPADVTLNAYPATPLAVRVTRGPERAPVVGTWVNVSSRGIVDWVDAGGEKRSGRAGVQDWLTTDADGLARTGVGRGELELRLRSGDWTEERTIEVASGEPIEVDFFRPWLGDRQVAVSLTLDGARYEPSENLIAEAWSPRPPYLPLEFEVEARPDGTFAVGFDAEDLSVFIFDPDRRRSGFARLGPGDSEVELTMEPMASYSGLLVDDQGQPLPDRTVRLSVQSAVRKTVVARRTDERGRFRFEGAPAGIPLRLDLEDEGEDPGYFLLGVERLFEPGEVREGDRIAARRRNSSASAAGAPTPLLDQVDNICENVRVSNMHALVVLMGDDSQGVVTATGRLLDADEVRPVLGFLAVRLEADRVEAEAEQIADLGWPRPDPGEIVLVALDGNREPIAASRIDAARADDAVAVGEEFLARHGPTPHDALADLAEARRSAEETGRRVWVVLGGPRCGPCFRMARWMDDHRDALEKDYVIVKVMSGLDANAAEVIAGFPESQGQGIPWFAITEADGSILATSEGPLGNIGFPGSLEGTRHLRRMLSSTARALTADEIEGLIGPLSPSR